MRFLLSGSLSALCFVAALLFWQPRSVPLEPIILADGDFVYHLHQPDATFGLDHDLDEISGLAFVDENTLAAVNDEQGHIFLYDLSTGRIIDEIDFGKGGDYEGIAVRGTTAYVLRSDGDVYEVANYRGDLRTEKYENPLRGANDAEGLSYDEATQQLLIACKASGRAEHPSASDEALVYGFSPNRPDELSPILSLDPRDVRPSGIARHPSSTHYYVLSSADKQLVIFGSDRQPRQRIKLPRSLFPQPEGICFAPDGILYVANEAKRDRAASGRATILQFNPRIDSP